MGYNVQENMLDNIPRRAIMQMEILLSNIISGITEIMDKTVSIQVRRYMEQIGNLEIPFGEKIGKLEDMIKKSEMSDRGKREVLSYLSKLENNELNADDLIAVINDESKKDLKRSIREICNETNENGKLLPIGDKIEKLRDLFTDGTIPGSLRKSLLEQLDKCEDDYIKRPAIYELKKLERLFKRKSVFPNMTQEDRIIAQKIIQSSIYSLHDPYTITVNSNQYNTMMKYIRNSGLSLNVLPVALKDGNYLFMFNADVRDAMENFAIAAGHDYGLITHPSKSDIEMQAYLEAEDKSTAALLMIKNVPPEIAEKAAIESAHVGEITFSKVKRDDGNFDLVCLGGKNSEDRDKKYSEAMKILALAAYSVTGTLGGIEAPKMRHMAHEYDDIEFVLDRIEDPSIDDEDCGYVFSINEGDGKGGSKIILADEYIEFSRDSYVAHKNDTAGRVVREAENPLFRQRLERSIKSGTGQKVYIPKTPPAPGSKFAGRKSMEEIETEAAELMTKLQNDYLSTGEQKLDIMEKLSAKSAELSQQIASESNSTLQLGLKEELRQTRVMFETVQEHKISDITQDTVKDRIIAEELKKHIFKKTSIKNERGEVISGEELAKSVSAEARMARWNVYNMGSKRDTPLLKNDIEISDREHVYSITAKDAQRILSSINPTKYIEHQRDLMNDMGYEGPKPTAEEIAYDESVYSSSHKEHISKAISALDGVEIQLEIAHPTISLDLGIESFTPESVKRAASLERYLNGGKRETKEQDKTKQQRVRKNRDFEKEIGA